METSRKIKEKNPKNITIGLLLFEGEKNAH